MNAPANIWNHGSGSRSHHRSAIFALIATIVSIVGSPVSGEDSPHWRGPHFNGSSGNIGLPSQWSTSENIAWVAELPGSSAATPVVYGDTVLVSSVDVEHKSLVALCFDRKSGATRWQKKIADGVEQDTRSNYASPSPTTDGQVAIFFYGNGELVAFDLEGNERWRRNIQHDLGPFAFQWTFSSSPTLWNKRLYLQVLQRDVAVEGKGKTDQPNESYLLALDPATGTTMWRHVRPSDAVAESREAFSTPIPFEFAGRKQLLIAGGDSISSHDAETGDEIWRWGTWNPERIPHWRLVPSPVAGGGVVLACAPKRSPIYALKAGGQGVLEDSALAWVSTNSKEVSSDVPTPAFADGDFFVLSDVQKSLSRVDPKSGAVRWTMSVPGRAKYEASPLVADGKIYIVNFDGLVGVVDAANGKSISEIAMDEPTEGEMVRSSIVCAGKQLFVRTTRKLYCVGNGS